MLRQPSCGEIVNQSECCRFDMCWSGALKDPMAALPIRKGLNVWSSSQALRRAIHAKMCDQQHQHRQIAGSTKVGGARIAMSSFTENCPRKFARQVAKVILHDVSKECPTYAIRDQPDTPTTDEHPTKNRRLGSKMSRAVEQRFSETTWQRVMSLADQTAPRVGALVLESGELVQQVQKMCHDHMVHHVVFRRGTDRYPGPTCQMPPGTAPLRRRICIWRRHEDINIDEEWEPWEKLTYKGLRRKGIAARVSLTLFAKAKYVVGQPMPMPAASSQELRSAEGLSNNIPNDQSLEVGIENPDAKRLRIMPPEVPATQSASFDIDRDLVDLAANKHGSQVCHT